jgi:hypothetical protein
MTTKKCFPGRRHTHPAISLSSPVFPKQERDIEQQPNTDSVTEMKIIEGVYF